MQQLTGLDNSFLRLEGPSMYGHVASLAIFDPATAPHAVGYQDVRELVASRLHLVPPFRRRLVEVPLLLLAAENRRRHRQRRRRAPRGIPAQGTTQQGKLFDCVLSA